MNPKLYLVPTPIGNLEDITLRAINMLKSVDVILAEDTRTSGHLLKHLGISKPLQSYHIHNEHQTVQRIIQRLLKGENMALISDAGTPAVSDPVFCWYANASKTASTLNVCLGLRLLYPPWSIQDCPPTVLLLKVFAPQKRPPNAPY